MAFASEDQSVPFYLQPQLGGNKLLRGFDRHRFHDENLFIATAEHRWHVYSGLTAALFVDAGKVASRVEEVDFSDLELAGGIGLRFKLRDRVVMRIDQAVSREGYRVMWTFGNVF